MIHDAKAVTVRWQRRNADVIVRQALFAEFRVGDLPPGSLAYQNLEFAIATKQVAHALRNATSPIFRRVLR